MNTKKLITTVFTLGVLGIALSNSAESIAASDLIGSKKIDLPNGKSAALVTVRKTDQVLGHPYTIEVRSNCNAQSSAPLEQQPVVQAKNVCDVKPASAKLSADGKSVLVTIRETDSEAFNEATSKAEGAELGKLRPQCKTESTQLTISIESLCGN